MIVLEIDKLGAGFCFSIKPFLFVNENIALKNYLLHDVYIFLMIFTPEW